MKKVQLRKRMNPSSRKFRKMISAAMRAKHHKRKRIRKKNYKRCMQFYILYCAIIDGRSLKLMKAHRLKSAENK